METDVYATIIGAKESPVYHRVYSVKKIISGVSSERIIFGNGEIELKAYENELRIYSKTYLSNGESLITRQIIKNLIPDYNPQKALNKAKMSILQRVVNLEMKAREEETARIMRSRLKLMYGFAKKQNLFEKNISVDLEKAVNFH
jgi:hypothetical protein